MIKRLLVILIPFSLSYGDTTIVAFDAVHQSFGNLGKNRTITQFIPVSYTHLTLPTNREV